MRQVIRKPRRHLGTLVHGITPIIALPGDPSPGIQAPDGSLWRPLCGEMGLFHDVLMVPTPNGKDVWCIGGGYKSPGELQSRTVRCPMCEEINNALNSAEARELKARG